MLEIGAITNRKDGASTSGYSPKVKESISGTDMREIGRQECVTDSECSIMPMDRSMKAIGKIT